MRHLTAVVLVLACAGSGAWAQDAPLGEPLPPPGMHEPGVQPSAAAPGTLPQPFAEDPAAAPATIDFRADNGAPPTGADDSGVVDSSAPGATPPTGDGARRAANAPEGALGAEGIGSDALSERARPPGDPTPEVRIRTDTSSGDVIEEYRQGGVVYMVRVRPERGPEYTLLDTNGDGRLDAQDGEGPVRPVYWTLYEWE